MIRFDPTAMTDPLARISEAARQDANAPAVVTKVVRDGHSAEFVEGVSDLSTGIAATADQTFDIGSQAKMMTAVVVLQLAEQGLISLDAPAAHWLPDSIVAGIPNADTATVRQLLNMTSGIPNYTEATGKSGLPLFVESMLAHPDQVFGPEGAFEIARGMTATGAPGERYNYTNTAYALLGALVEHVTGEAFADVLEERVFDPAGMHATTARSFGSDDPRLSSYATDPGTGERIDVTHAPWQLRGEGGVVSNTTDLIAFLKALLVDQTLLGPEALAEMTDFAETASVQGASEGFGLGLAQIRIDGGPNLVGFTGQTLGCQSSTYLDLTTGTFVSVAGTVPEIETTGAVYALTGLVRDAAAWDPVADQGGPVLVESGSAAHLALEPADHGVTLTLGGAALTLAREITDLTSDSFRFADHSVLKFGGAGADVLSIGRHTAAWHEDNQLRGRGGDDHLTGGAGNDLLLGQKGNDCLRGGAGADRLKGGCGDDHLSGGAGRDILTGRAGDDVFRFTGADDTPGRQSRDQVTDFHPGADRIDLRALGGGEPLTWIGGHDFDHVAGELRYAKISGHVLIEADLDGDGSTDFAVDLHGAQGLTAGDFLL